MAAIIVGIGVELGQRELHLTKNRAGVIVVAGLAVLFGQAEVAGRQHKLNAALHTDNREHANGNVNVICAYAVNKVAIEARADKLGNSVDAHTAVAKGTATLDKLAVQADRRRNLDHNGGKSRLAVATEIVLVEAEAVLFGVGRKHGYILFASEEYNLLIECAKSLYLLNSAAAHTCLESYTEIITDGYLIKAFVEGYGLDVDIGVYYLNAFASYGACLIDDFLTHIAKVHAEVLETVLITCRIENFIHADAAKLFLVAAKPTEGAVSFNHLNSSLSVWTISFYRYYQYYSMRLFAKRDFL